MEKRPLELPLFDDPAELVNAVISTLAVPDERTTVSVDFANEKNAASEIQAYAKIAGRDWTYYVKTLEVSIGRNTDVQPQSGSSVHIDLGPAKVVSRQHAQIKYNPELRCWELIVLGRNGARVDGAKMPVGPQHAAPLHLGAIVDVGGTQMMFILPDTPPLIAPKLLSLCLARYQPGAHKRAKTGAGITTGSQLQTPYSMLSFQMFEKGALAHLPSSVLAVSLQNNLDQDLLREDAKDIKPPYLYATMITQAILLNPDGVMSLSEIYTWILSRYAYYKYSKTGWQNLIRHNLSLNKAFEKVPRRPNEPGKGMKWQISDSYRNDFLQKVQTGTLSKLRRGSSVSRTLQMHLATHQGLPEAKLYASENGASLEARPVSSQGVAQAHPGQIGLGHTNQGPPLMLQKPGLQGSYQVPQTGYGMPQNGYMPYNYQRQAMYQGNQALGAHALANQNLGNQANQHHLPYQPQQSANQQQHQTLQPPEKRMELASPMRHQSIDTKQSYAPQQNGIQNNGSYAPGVNLFKPTPTQPKLEPTADNGVSKTAYSNNSHMPNTSESMIQNSTAPTTSNTLELGLNFTSPKKVVPLEAFTPERGSKSVNLAKPGTNNVNQSSPAFWNFVQFSTPNGQTPGRKNSDESNGPESPTLNRRPIEQSGENVYDDSPPK